MRLNLEACRSHTSLDPLSTDPGRNHSCALQVVADRDRLHRRLPRELDAALRVSKQLQRRLPAAHNLLRAHVLDLPLLPPSLLLLRLPMLQTMDPRRISSSNATSLPQCLLRRPVDDPLLLLQCSLLPRLRQMLLTPVLITHQRRKRWILLRSPEVEVAREEILVHPVALPPLAPPLVACAPVLIDPLTQARITSPPRRRSCVPIRPRT